MTFHQGLLLLSSLFSLTLNAEMPPMPPTGQPILSVLIDGTGGGSIKLFEQTCSSNCSIAVPPNSTINKIDTLVTPDKNSIYLGATTTPPQNIYPLVITGNVTLRITFQLRMKSIVTITRVGNDTGTVTSQYENGVAGPIQCGTTCTSPIDYENLKLIAEPKDQFVGWQGGQCFNVVGNICTVKSSEAYPVMDIKAVFKPKALDTHFSVLITKPRPRLENGIITGTSSPRVTLQGIGLTNEVGAGCNGTMCYCPQPPNPEVPPNLCLYKMYKGALVQLAADGDTANRVHFEKWNKDGVEFSHEPALWVTIDQAKVMEAVFVRDVIPRVKLEVAITPDIKMGWIEGPRILYGATDYSVTPPVARGKYSTQVGIGRAVKLTANVMPGYEFCEWVGRGNMKELNFIATTDTSVTARFASNCNPTFPTAPSPTNPVAGPIMPPMPSAAPTLAPMPAPTFGPPAPTPIFIAPPAPTPTPWPAPIFIAPPAPVPTPWPTPVFLPPPAPSPVWYPPVPPRPF